MTDHGTDTPPTRAALTPAERKRLQRARQKAGGLERIEVWARPEHHERIRRYVARLPKRVL